MKKKSELNMVKSDSIIKGETSSVPFGISDEMRTYILKCAKEILSKFIDKKIKEENLPNVLLSFCKANKLTDIKNDESLDKNLNQHLFLSKECKNRPPDYFYNLLYLYNILTNKTTRLFSEPSENSKDLRTDTHVTSKESGSSSPQSSSSCDQSLVPVQGMGVLKMIYHATD
ncbi:hypothetical protein Anas_10779 [Armadillidium nasatum]|uniref:Uncharacterized protein n=1 Tax=Armadillidium nasatum TaxID=96803 RepID=A0A5N5T6U7_9CRUS|nr:hypothetical protein Anas_10779 [Armadillidium nasatum]